MIAKKRILRISSVLFICVFILSSVPLQVVQAADVLFAKPAAGGSGDCSTWEDACTLQSALSNAVRGNEIWVAQGVYKPTTLATDRAATFLLRENVAVYGGFDGITDDEKTDRDPAAHATILSGDIDNNDSQTPIITDLETVTGNTSNSYHVVTGADVAVLDGFTITAGFTDGSIDPFTPVGGGGLYNDSSSPTITNVTFRGNHAVDVGGGMLNYVSNPTLSNVTFSDNSAYWGGGMYIIDSSPTLTIVTFSGNQATEGGGIFNDHSSPTLSNVLFDGNQANYGGGMYNFYTTSTLTITTFSGNHAIDVGGGIYNLFSDSTITNVTFSDNSADIVGGGMYITGNNPVLLNVTFSGNQSRYGGGMYIDASSPVITNTTFSGNHSNNSGGGMFNNGSTVLTNTTFSDNEAGDSGGGMYNYYYSNPTLTNTTFSDNSANKGGGIYNLNNSSPIVRNSIFWGNTGGQFGGDYVEVTDSVLEGGYATGTNIITADPRLGTLGNYGGFTQTIPLLAGSSAIDTANDDYCPDTDQRDVHRPQGAGCDIGAFEGVIYWINLPLIVR
jgi:hypothetical protein